MITIITNLCVGIPTNDDSPVAPSFVPYHLPNSICNIWWPRWPGLNWCCKVSIPVVVNKYLFCSAFSHINYPHTWWHWCELENVHHYSFPNTNICNISYTILNSIYQPEKKTSRQADGMFMISLRNLADDRGRLSAETCSTKPFPKYREILEYKPWGGLSPYHTLYF